MLEKGIFSTKIELIDFFLNEFLILFWSALTVHSFPYFQLCQWCGFMDRNVSLSFYHFSAHRNIYSTTTNYPTQSMDLGWLFFSGATMKGKVAVGSEKSQQLLDGPMWTFVRNIRVPLGMTSSIFNGHLTFYFTALKIKILICLILEYMLKNKSAKLLT